MAHGRLEGLFHQISLIHLMEREEVEDEIQWIGERLLGENRQRVKVSTPPNGWVNMG